MSLVRSRHLRSSSKRRIHPPLLSFFRDDDIFRSTGVHINASSPSKQDLYEHPRRVPGHATIKHSLDSEEAKKSENDFAFAFTAKVLSNGDEKNASLESFKKVDSNVKLFSAVVVVRALLKRRNGRRTLDFCQRWAGHHDFVPFGFDS